MVKTALELLAMSKYTETPPPDMALFPLMVPPFMVKTELLRPVLLVFEIKTPPPYSYDLFPLMVPPFMVKMARELILEQVIVTPPPFVLKGMFVFSQMVPPFMVKLAVLS